MQTQYYVFNLESKAREEIVFTLEQTHLLLHVAYLKKHI